MRYSPGQSPVVWFLLTTLVVSMLCFAVGIGAALAITGDADDDGVADQYECQSLATTDAGCPDADGDGRPDYLDPDDDADGIATRVEGTEDPDRDGVPNYLDRDSDGDHVPDAVDGAGDADNDGIPNYLDPDDDNDGIPTSWEQIGDVDNDGHLNHLDTDSDNDGLPDGVEGTGDVDNDGIANYLDTDSDGDGINDGDEGVADSDRDGIENFVDNEFNANNVTPAAAENDDKTVAVTQTDSARDAVALLASTNVVLGRICKSDHECASGKCEGDQCVCSTNSDCPGAPGFGDAEPFCVKSVFKRNECILRCETDKDCSAETPSCGTKLGTRYRRCR